jgi:septal ring factor EnvC (AmiA/AmiB activator)
MELLHDSDHLVGKLDCQLKSLEEKIDTSHPAAIMKDLHRMDDEIKHFKDVKKTMETVVTSVKEQGETIKKLVSKINDIGSRVNNLEERINLAVRELKSEARKTSVLRKLLWLD